MGALLFQGWGAGDGGGKGRDVEAAGCGGMWRCGRRLVIVYAYQGCGACVWLHCELGGKIVTMHNCHPGVYL